MIHQFKIFFREKEFIKSIPLLLMLPLYLIDLPLFSCLIFLVLYKDFINPVFKSKLYLYNYWLRSVKISELLFQNNFVLLAWLNVLNFCNILLSFPLNLFAKEPFEIHSYTANFENIIFFNCMLLGCLGIGNELFILKINNIAIRFLHLNETIKIAMFLVLFIVLFSVLFIVFVYFKNLYLDLAILSFIVFIWYGLIITKENIDYFDYV